MQILCRDGVGAEINRLRGNDRSFCTAVALGWRCLRHSGALANAVVHSRKPQGGLMRA
jgi:hypothetical protein